jgi:hypothetical protein
MGRSWPRNRRGSIWQISGGRMDQQSLELSKTAAAAFHARDWTTARQLYQEILQDPSRLSRSDMVAVLGNLIQAADFSGAKEEAITAADKALSLIGRDPPWKSNDEARLSGVAKQCLTRLRGDPVDHRGTRATIAAWLTGSELGALAGLKVAPLSGSLAWVDFRCAGAVVGAVLGFFLLTDVFFYRQHVIFVASAVGLFMTLVVLFSGNILSGSLTAILLAIPVILWLRFLFLWRNSSAE